MPNIKHRIFISSTFTDLISQRQQLFMATYRINHIPLGMEGFTATNKSQWDHISKRVIESDYFVLIIANRYGSEVPDGSGKSFTEAEYDLAVSLKIPILRFLLDEHEPWPTDAKHGERSSKTRAKLNAFKDKVSRNNLISFWNKQNLEAMYSQAILNIIQDEPRGGLCPIDKHPGLEELGIDKIISNSNVESHSKILESNELVAIFLNDGYNYLKKYQGNIADRVINSKPTRVLLIHPDSPNTALIAKKSYKELDAQKRDILNSIKALKNLNSQSANKEILKCCGHFYMNSYSATMNERLGIVSLYFNRMRSNELTTLFLDSAKGNLHAKYLDDLDQLWRESENLKNSDLLMYPPSKKMDVQRE